MNMDPWPEVTLPTCTWAPRDPAHLDFSLHFSQRCQLPL